MQLLKHYKTKRLRIISADMPFFVSRASQLGVVINRVVPIDDLTWEFSISSVDYKKVKSLANDLGCQDKLILISGIGTIVDRIKQRPILTVLITFLIGLSLLLPNWIFFISVEGNQRVSTQLILETAEKSGITFGAYRRGIRSETVKNSMLSHLSDLSWVGINTRGCVATISVREREPVQVSNTLTGSGSIVASRDGIIAELTVLRGAPLCKVGDAVSKGQVLISGYTDMGLLVRKEEAAGEIFAITNRQFSAISHTNTQIRQAETKEIHTYWFFVGKKLIKLWKDSGISGATCVKMYETKYITLPGGFRLPCGILIQKETAYACTQSNTGEVSWLEDRCQAYLLSQMNAGKVLNSRVVTSSQNDVISAICNYTCHEMIGQIRYEEIFTDYGKSN